MFAVFVIIDVRERRVNVYNGYMMCVCISLCVMCILMFIYVYMYIYDLNDLL